MPRIGEPSEKCLPFFASPGRRMTSVMEADKGANPIDVGILGAYAAMQIATALAQLFEHSCSFQRREGSRAAFHDLFGTE